MTTAISPRQREQAPIAAFELPVPTKTQQISSLYERKDGTLTALGKDRLRKIVTPYVSATGNIGWMAREHADNSRITSYPIDKQDSRAGRILIQALMRSIVQGEMEIRADHNQWGEEAVLVKKAITVAQGIRSSHSSDHEHFDIRQFPEYQQFAYQPSRRQRRIAQMQSEGEFDGIPHAAAGYGA